MDMEQKKKKAKKFKQLTLQDRITIEINYRNGLGIREIARNTKLFINLCTPKYEEMGMARFTTNALICELNTS